MSLCRWTLLLLLSDALLPECQSFQQPMRGQFSNGRRCVTLPLASFSDPNENPSSPPKPKGVYVRPSAAIERGSGFFFPGLEGPRVRLFVGCGLLMATAINHAFSTSTSSFPEGLGVVYSLLVLLQGGIEATKEGRMETVAASGPQSTAQLVPHWRPSAGEEDGSFRDRVQWAATSFLSLTKATHMILIHNDRVIYWLGVTPDANPDSSNRQRSAEAALATLRQSKGGRVALPNDHPAIPGIITEDAYRRCVLLQRINPNKCWMVASNDLLASFSKQDLLWLGQLAAYVDNHEQ